MSVYHYAREGMSDPWHLLRRPRHVTELLRRPAFCGRHLPPEDGHDLQLPVAQAPDGAVCSACLAAYRNSVRIPAVRGIFLASLPAWMRE